jgi:hypothetical protein
MGSLPGDSCAYDIWEVDETNGIINNLGVVLAGSF